MRANSMARRMAKSPPSGGELPVVLGDDRAAAREFAAKSKADETIRAYEHDFTAFEKYCAVHGHPSLPATPDAVCEFLASEEARGCQASTLTRRVASIRYRHKLNKHPSPTDDEMVSAVLSGIKREIGSEQTPKTAATADVVGKMLETCDGTLAGKRNRALISLGFAGAFRRSELVALEVADLTETADGLRVFVRSSKTDQTGKGQYVAILRGRRLRPVEAVQAWLAASRIVDGPIFRQVSRSGRLLPLDRVNKKGRALPDALTAESAAQVVKDAAERAGYDPAVFAGHSLRRGFLTSAAKAGASIFKMMDVSRHRSVETLRRYVKDANEFQDHAGEDFL